MNHVLIIAQPSLQQSALLSECIPLLLHFQPMIACCLGKHAQSRRSCGCLLHAPVEFSTLRAEGEDLGLMACEAFVGVRSGIGEADIEFADGGSYVQLQRFRDRFAR